MADGSRVAFELCRALRPHQWSKNLLVFVPLALTPALSRELHLWQIAFFAFVAWSAVASLGYLVNDWVDRAKDRADSLRRDRPFASGRLPGGVAVAAGTLLAAFGAGLALALAPPVFALYLLGYLGTSLAYSFFLKRVLLVDVLVLAGLYTLRLLGGGAAVGIALTPWLLAFSLFLFLGMAFVKRYGELCHMTFEGAGAEPLPGRAYRVGDVPLIMTFGIASTYLSVLVLCLYINGARVEGQYPRAWVLWFGVPLLLYWTSRVWVRASRGELGGDPVAFAVSDPVSLAIGALMTTVLLVALGVPV